MSWTKIADDGVAQGLLFDEILDNIRKEMGFFDSPKRNEVYDYLMENYERDKLFSNKFTVKKSLPLETFDDVEERIADSFNKLFNLLDAIEQSLNQM